MILSWNIDHVVVFWHTSQYRCCQLYVAPVLRTYPLHWRNEIFDIISMHLVDPMRKMLHRPDEAQYTTKLHLNRMHNQFIR